MSNLMKLQKGITYEQAITLVLQGRRAQSVNESLPVYDGRFQVDVAGEVSTT